MNKVRCLASFIETTQKVVVAVEIDGVIYHKVIALKDMQRTSAPDENSRGATRKGAYVNGQAIEIQTRIR